MDNNKTGYIQLAATGNIRLMVQTPNTQVWKKKKEILNNTPRLPIHKY